MLRPVAGSTADREIKTFVQKTHHQRTLSDPLPDSVVSAIKTDKHGNGLVVKSFSERVSEQGDFGCAGKVNDFASELME